MDKLSDKRRCDLRVDEYFTKEGAIEHLDLIVTGVPRAGRDPELTSAPTSTPLTRIAERQPEGVALRVSTTLGERDLYMKEHHPRPTPPPDTSERRYVRATISPQSEGHPGILIEGTYMLSNSTVQVFDMRGALLGTEPVPARRRHRSCCETIVAEGRSAQLLRSASVPARVYALTGNRGSRKRPGPPASKSTGRDLPRPGRGPDHDQDEPYFEAGRADRAVQKMRAAVQKNDRCLGRLSNAETTA